MSRIAYINGRYVPKSHAQVAVEDRGYLFSDGVIVGAIVRDQQVIIATGDTALEKDDHVVLFAASDAVRDVERLFSVRLEYF